MPGTQHGTIIVVGASSGIGQAMAMRLAHEARPVALLARREDELQRVCAEINAKVGANRAHAYVHDATDLESIERLFTRIEADLGEVDELHYVAGVMPAVEMDEFSTAKDELMVRINMIGCMGWVNTAARRFLPRKRGHIVGVSSVAGDRGRMDRPGYNASKSGQDTYLESIRNRLWRHGIFVTTARPGPVETPMIEGVDAPMAIPADQAARTILKARDRKRAVVYVPARWRLIMFVIRSIPSFLFRKLSV